ncbi:EamA family transporter [Mitsuaria sp. GD03876]|uniref:EamA family transporter n=1 Tax=Mitsuaria sp. GD03876 TaxID=2975399 RepID=UPI00244BB21F|nr:EamA family transporter [Mitsuaria sp. GD03876]MDH0863917.1 EamA family transporter [Mitsuaria sp. GD03876]
MSSITPATPVAAATPAGPATSPGLNTKLLWCLALVYVIWGSTYLAIKVAIAGLPPFLLAATRYATAGVLLFALMRFKGAPWPSWRQWRNALAMGFLMVSVGNGFVCLAVGHISSSAAAVIYACGPMFALVFDRLRGGRALAVEWLGVGLGIAGVLLIHADKALQANWFGSIAVLLACAGMSLAVVLQPRLDLPRGGLSAPAQMLGGALCLVPMALAKGETWPASVPPSAWLAFAYLVVFGSMVAYSAYVYILHHASAGLATSNEYVNALVAMLLGYWLAGEAIGTPMLAGTVVILGGVGLIAWGHARRAAGLAV